MVNSLVNWHADANHQERDRIVNPATGNGVARQPLGSAVTRF
jgi:hypothetical protein